MCNDGNACSLGDTCQAGVCQPGAPKLCAATDQCHLPGTCNTTTGACTNPTANNGTVCSDGNACSLGDTCQSGVCMGATPVTCTASDQCHVPGTCDPTSGTCSNPNAPSGTTCSDGNACTNGDTCQSGVCQSGAAKVCTASDQCHLAGTCDTVSGSCSNPSTPNGTPCNDGNACTQVDTCQSGVCTGASPVVCTASDSCHTAGTCNTTTGLCSNPNATNGTTCSDGNACTLNDKCQAGVCGGTALSCPSPTACHTAGTCNPSTGVCSTPNSADGTPCNDGNACTQSDTCQSGVCVGSNPVVCTASDQCHAAGTCNTSTGACTNPNAAAGTVCNDGNACTTNDKCQSGVCNGTAVVCATPTSCQTAGTCNPATGVCTNPPVANGTACNDGNACTLTDTCQSGVCTGSNPVVCTASGQCKVPGVCNTGTGVCSIGAAPNGTACNDGNACTQTDTCQSGNCTGSNPVVCTPLTQCHSAGTCSAATGLCTTPFAPTGTACNDGDACTQPDTCSAGVCKGSTACNDGNSCTTFDSCIGGLCVGQNPGPANGTACDDKNACTSADTCKAGVCTGSAQSGVSCTDGNACTSGDTCQSGLCVPGASVVCPAPATCHAAGACDPQTGACASPNLADGTGCNDGNACTLTDTCQSGACVGANPVLCPTPDQCHTAGACDTVTGLCSNPPVASGTTCNDGTICTYTDTCQLGACIGFSSSAAACYQEDQKLVASPSPSTGPYRVVAIEGDTAVVQAGASLYVFDRIGGAFVWTTTLAASSGAALGSVAFDGDTIVAGAPGVSAAFVFTRSVAGVWGSSCVAGAVPVCKETVRLQASNFVLSDAFGTSVSISGDTVVVGSPQADSGVTTDGGSVYVYGRVGGVWSGCSGGVPQTCLEQAELFPSDPKNLKNFGKQVAIDGDTLIAAAPGDTLVPGKGSAYVLLRTAGLWSHQAKLVSSASASFGASVDVSGETVVVGSTLDDRSPASKAGSLYVFTRNGTAWSGSCSGNPVQCTHDFVTLIASDRGASDALGQAVSIRGQTILAGSIRHDHGIIPATVNSGAAYVFRRGAGTWGTACTGASPKVCVEDDELLPGDAATVFGFGPNRVGLSVALAGETAFVGSGSGPYVFSVPLSDGCGCASDLECLSGYCADGVCCDTACGGGDPQDSLACSVDWGAAQNGICQVVQSSVCIAGAACFDGDLCQ